MIPTSNPKVPITTEDGRHFATCRVSGCQWQRTSVVRAAVEEEARWHRQSHRRAAHEQDPS